MDAATLEHIDLLVASELQPVCDGLRDTEQDCPEPVLWVGLAPCCGYVYLACDAHHTESIESFARFLVQGRTPKHTTCGSKVERILWRPYRAPKPSRSETP